MSSGSRLHQDPRIALSILFRIKLPINVVSTCVTELSSQQLFVPYFPSHKVWLFDPYNVKTKGKRRLDTHGNNSLIPIETIKLTQPNFLSSFSFLHSCLTPSCIPVSRFCVIAVLFSRYPIVLFCSPCDVTICSLCQIIINLLNTSWRWIYPNDRLVDIPVLCTPDHPELIPPPKA
jgi:hypothetical protein